MSLRNLVDLFFNDSLTLECVFLWLFRGRRQVADDDSDMQEEENLMTDQ